MTALLLPCEGEAAGAWAGRLVGVAAGTDDDVEVHAHLPRCAKCRALVEKLGAALMPPGEPSVARTRDTQRALLSRIGRRERSRRRGWRPAEVFAATLLAATAGAAASRLYLEGIHPPKATRATREAVRRATEAEHPAVSSLAVHRASLEAIPRRAPTHPVPPTAPVPPTPAAPAVPDPWPVLVERALQSGDGAAAADATATAFAASEPGALEALRAVAKADSRTLPIVDRALQGRTDAEPMRVRCELSLLQVRDSSTVEACRAFAQAFPEHPAARLLAFASGRVAEDLGDTALAEQEYSRALLLAPFAGVPGSEALLARARMRARLGSVDEARADLRLFLVNEGAAADDARVVELAAELGVSLP